MPHTADEIFKSPITTIKSITPRRANLLKKLGICTVSDLIFHFPRTYQDWTELSMLSLADTSERTFLAVCVSDPQISYRGKLSTLRVRFADQSGVINAVWFNQPYTAAKLHRGSLYLIHGKTAENYRILQVPKIEEISGITDVDPSSLDPGTFKDTFIRPIYPLTKGLSQGELRLMIESALTAVEGREVSDPFPAEIRKKYHLCTRGFAVRNIHFPKDMESFRIARRRLVFEELFFIRLGLVTLKERRLVDNTKSFIIKDSKLYSDKMQDICNSLPYKLTNAQKRTLADIFKDMSANYPMDRMVQGDVGTGKTIIAGLAFYRVFLEGGQGIFMAPTSILAGQHYLNFKNTLEPFGVRIGLLNGKISASVKKKILKDFENGEIDIIVGTHAVLNKSIKPKNLALVVTDEQHRFGVGQRLNLSAEKGEITPHVIVMSATPIPRSLALILYGDLSVSVIDEKPVGRLPVLTYTVRTQDLDRAWSLCDKQIHQGHQIYVVCPLKGESDNIDLISAEEMSEALKDKFPGIEIALLHGGMKENEKSEVMQKFYDGSVKILVSTTVVEVGVDCPNATVLMVIQAERFGLAQLHQLRGRVGRGTAQSYCLLYSDVGQGIARERMTVLCNTNDGYKIAERDLELRGPGDFFGTRQHGLPEFKIANLYEDSSVLSEVKEAVSYFEFNKTAFIGDGGREWFDSALETFWGNTGHEIGL